MLLCRLRRFLILPFLCSVGLAQVMSIPSSGFGNIGSHDMGTVSGAVGLNLISSEMMTNEMYGMMTSIQNRGSEEVATTSISKLDLKAPGKARREYEKGYQLLMRKDLQGAIEHLNSAIESYPEFVAAHNALGTAYLNSGQQKDARDEFLKVTSLDDHLPNSYLNLGCAQLALNDYPGAEESFRKASSMAPLDLPLLLALTYGEFANKNYTGVISTVHEVHERKHKGAAMVHFFAAGAWEAQSNLAQAQQEMKTLLQEEPHSPSAEQFRKVLEELNNEEQQRAKLKFDPVQKVTYSIGVPIGPSPEIAGQMAQIAFQNMERQEQIAEAEAAPDPICKECASGNRVNSVRPSSGIAPKFAGLTTFRSAVDEVSIMFAATDHGRSVINLNVSDVGLRDNRQPPAAISHFRNESQLPLRLGLVIDTSNSVTDRFHFEQAAAIKFLETVVTDKDDLSFVIGVNNSVLLVQDFTSDLQVIGKAINQLAPGGGTAIWDALSFASQKLASRPEPEPVARVLVVISDGEDNSSTVSLREAIQQAQRGDVAIYTICTRDFSDDALPSRTGEHALRTFSELTGGAAFVPGSIHRLTSSLSDLQQVIRSRYLISYKPAAFERDGKYRPIDITAAKDGHKLRVYARRGYYAEATQTSTPQLEVTQ